MNQLDRLAQIAQRADDEDLSADELLAESGIMTNYAVENHCANCGNNVDGTQDAFTEIDGTPFGRPDTTVMVHIDCNNRKGL